VGGGAAERLVQDVTRPVTRRHCSSVRIHPCRLRAAPDLHRLTAGTAEPGRCPPTTAASTCGWLHIAWLSTGGMYIISSHSKSIGVYHTSEPPTDTIMASRSAATSGGTLCEGLQQDLTGMRRIVCNSTVVYHVCSVCTLYNHAQENVMTL